MSQATRRLAVAAAFACAGAAPSVASAGAPYVALGDSFAAGPLIPNQNPVVFNCLRSSQNYPSELAKRLGLSLDDRSCSGATADDMTRWQGLNAPQFWALGRDTRLVTLSIGANDVGLFTDVLSCIRLLPVAPCKSYFVINGVDTIHEEIVAWAPKIGTTLDGIRKLAPSAQVVVTSYGNYLRPGGCYPLQPVLPEDGDYLVARLHELNAALEGAAAQRGMTFVDLDATSRGHDTCAGPGERWIEGLIPLSPAAPLHPNALGMDNYAALIQSAL